MAVHVHMKMGDSAPGQPVQLIGTDGQPVNLSGATIVMHARGHDVAIPCDAADVADGTVYPSIGTLTPDEGYDSKEFDVEWEVSYLAGGVQTFPQRGYDKLTVWRDLDPV
jgi:hypothetical protein